MTVIIAQVDDPSKVLPAIGALAGVLPVSSIKVLKEAPLPPPATTAVAEAEALAKKIATLIAPTAKHTMRVEALKMALCGGDTFWDQEGEADPAMRNAMGALSKALRPLFKYDASPIDRIAERKKHFDKNGMYLGTRYQPTALGLQVRAILKKKGHI